MEIDWITIAAQIVNFLVLVWLLRRFLYKPVTDAIAAREQKIRDRLNDAADKKKTAEEEAARLKELREDIEARRETLLDEAREESGRLKKALEAAARDDIEEISAAWRRDVDDERAAFIADLRQSSISQFYELSREALGSLAGVSLNEAIAEKFIARLSKLDGESLAKLRESSGENGHYVLVQSSFELDEEMKKRISASIHEHIAADAWTDYQLADDLICGIRLKSGGQTIGWTLTDYLDRLEEQTLKKLDDVTAPERQAAE